MDVCIRTIAHEIDERHLFPEVVGETAAAVEKDLGARGWLVRSRFPTGSSHRGDDEQTQQHAALLWGQTYV